MYKCPITNQTGHFHIGGESFYDWASRYFGEFHTYEDDDSMPMPCYSIWLQADSPDKHVDFVKWCAKQSDAAYVIWLNLHAEENKVPDIQKIVDQARLELKLEIKLRILASIDARKKDKARNSKKRKTAASKGAATRRAKKFQSEQDAKKRSLAAMKAWATRRKNQKQATLNKVADTVVSGRRRK